MSSLSTSANNNNFYSLLTTDKKLFTKNINQLNTAQSQSIQTINLHQVNNIYNKLDFEKLKGKKRYENFPLFSMREIRLEKEKKKKLTLRLRKKLLGKKKVAENISSQSSLYITQNLSEGNFSNLPKILEKFVVTNNNKKNLKRTINNKRHKIIKVSSQNQISKTEKAPVNHNFLKKLKNSLDIKKRKNEGNKTENNLLKKKIKDANIYRNTENSYKTYIDKIHDFLNIRKIYDSKKEGYLQFLEFKRNQIESVEDKIKTMQTSQRLLDNKFLIKYQEYLASLYKEKDRLENKDIILCTKLFELRNIVLLLEKKIKKLLVEKNIYRKWLLFQVQVKEKYLKMPKKYHEYLKIG